MIALVLWSFVLALLPLSLGAISSLWAAVARNRTRADWDRDTMARSLCLGSAGLLTAIDGTLPV